MLVDHLGFSCLESYDKYMPVCIPDVVAAAAAAASATVEPWETYNTRLLWNLPLAH